MFGLLKGLAEVAVKTVTLPVTVVADTITLGGELVDKKGGTYTGDMLSSIGKSIEEMTDD